MRKVLTSVLIAGFLTLTIFEASRWWERAWATKVNSVASPDGCLQLDVYEPYWLLPTMFHISPNPESGSRIGDAWEYPAFFKLRDARSGDILAQSIIFDAQMYSAPPMWGHWKAGGKRRVSIGSFLVGETTHCTDIESEQKMDAHYKQLGRNYDEIMRRVSERQAKARTR